VETDDGNVASQRLAERLGAVFEGADGGLRRYVVAL
jgi:[ribosomal protein S5]-alanine N-acetyltransferase